MRHNQGETDSVEIGREVREDNRYGEYLMKGTLTELGDFKIGGTIINKVRFVDDTAFITKTQEELEVMVSRLVNTGRKYGMEINIDKSQLMRVSIAVQSK